MKKIDRDQLEALESRLGLRLPPDFRATLTEREPIREGCVALVTSDRVWDVRTSFGLDNGDKEIQLDRLYELVGDVLPPYTLPFAEDWAGNLYCLMLSGPLAGRVVWWNHERDESDHSVEPVAASVEDFYARLVPDPRDEQVERGDASQNSAASHS